MLYFQNLIFPLLLSITFVNRRFTIPFAAITGFLWIMSLPS